MIYKIKIKRAAQGFIDKQPKDVQLRIYRAIYGLPFRGDIKQLKGQDNKFRLRVGGFRIIYSVFDDVLLIEILKVGNRGDVYKE
jgi:mRNA interferase RelE/StbE